MSDQPSNKQALRGELYFFRTIFTITDLVSNSFYYILLFKATNQFSSLFIDLIIFFIAQWAGFIIGNTLIPKLGYIKTFKLSFLLNLLIMILLVASLGNLALLYPVFAILRAFPRGIFWAVNNNYLIRELDNTNRGIVVSDIVSITYVLQILLPVLIGATITVDNNYSILFILSGTISLVCLVIPWRYNKKPRTEITSDEISKILNNKKFKALSIRLLIAAGLDASVALSFAIVPFLFLNNEFSVGILLTVINFVAAIFAFMQRSKKIEKVKKTAFFGVGLSAIANILLVVFWGLPALLLRGLFATVGESLYLPLTEKLDLEIRKEILQDDINRSAAEMSMIVESLFTIGRVLALVLFLLIFTIVNSENIFRLIIFVYGFWIIFYLSSMLKLHKTKESTIDLTEHFNVDLKKSNTAGNS